MKRLVIVMALLLALCGCAKTESATMQSGKEMQSLTTENARSAADTIVFFGDSITADSNFEEYYPELTIVNLGVYGDTLEDMLARVDEVRAAKPKQIFLLGGINCLRPDNVERCAEQYAVLLDALREACPDAAICVESVLPVGAELDPDGSENDAVRCFNAALVTLAQEKGCDYVDIYAAYEQDGALNPALTRDGIHLNFTAYGPWADCIAQFINADNFK